MSRSNPWKRKQRHTRHTTLIVVEGDTEENFLKHLQSACGRDCGTRLTIENTHGGSGDFVLQKAISLCQPFDVCACLYDADRKATKQKNLAKARRLKITQIISDPAIESLLLRILGRKPPSDTKRCKEQLDALVSGDSLTTIKGFEKHFPFTLLNEKRTSIEPLDAIIKLVDRRKSGSLKLGG